MVKAVRDVERRGRYGAAIISQAIDKPRTTVQRWLSKPDRTTTKGRKPYVAPDDGMVVVGFVAEADARHNGVSVDRLGD